MKTVIRIYKDGQGHIVKFIADGHTGAGAQGEDILCAAISAIIQTAALGLSEVLKLSLGYEMRDGYFECVLPGELEASELEKADIILQTMLIGLKNLQSSYKNHIDILELEV